jgi:hypothetical protein
MAVNLWPTPPPQPCDSTSLEGNLRNGLDALLIGLGVGIAAYITAKLVSGEKKHFIDRPGTSRRPHPLKTFGGKG